MVLAVRHRPGQRASPSSPGAPLTENLPRFLAFTLATSLGFDIPRALTTAVLVAVAGRPVLLALRRAARRAAFEAVPTFAPPVPDGTMAR